MGGRRRVCLRLKQYKTIPITGKPVDCPFCKLAADRIVHAGDHTIAVRDAFPVSPGHTLVIPRRHVASLFETTERERAELLSLLALARDLLEREYRPAGYNVGVNDGAVAGQTVMHLHVHLIPRYPGDREDPRGGVRWVLPDRAAYWTERMQRAVTSADPFGIEHFVRGTLGCRCPDEVFHSIKIDRQPATAGRPPLVQLLVGSRLLIHVVTTPLDGLANGWLEDLVDEGRAVRDRNGYNRFRLVIASAETGARPSDLEQRFARAIGSDDRAHLHVLGRDQLPAGLAVPLDAAGPVDSRA